MKIVLWLTLAVFCSLCNAAAQSVGIVTSQKHDPSFSMGRDIWLVEQSNYWGQNTGNKYLELYLTSPKATTAYVEFQGGRKSLKIQPLQVTNFAVPAAWEMESSGIVENKAIHVWSLDAPLIVGNMNHNNYTADGEYEVPSIGWDSEYVVAAYGSLFEGFGSYIYDLPSTCAVIADRDSTIVTITPSCDCRQCTSGNYNGDANSTIVVFPAGQPFTSMLNRGQSLELMPVKATGPDSFDVTGTIIHANHLVGVMGGSMCPNIPANFPYCDHVEDMMPSQRTWGRTYLTSNYLESASDSTGHYACYLFASSKPNQTIYRSNCTDGTHAECIIPKQYGIVWDELELGQKFFSDAPFLCEEYINSATYPDGTNGTGDPAESNVIPMERFTKSLIFQFPTQGNSYTDYANIAVNNNDIGKLKLDGSALTGFSSQCVDNNWQVITTPVLSSGVHTLTGDDSGVSVYLYGYGYDETYAWTAPSFEGTYQGPGRDSLLNPDSVAPTASLTGNCDSGRVVFADGGVHSSQLAAVWIDSSSNMAYSLDTSWKEGIPRNKTFFNYSVLDESAPFYLQVSAYDFAGNSTTITISSHPRFAASSDSLQFGEVNFGGFWILYDTLTNLTADTLPLDSIILLHGKSGFEIDSAITSPLFPGDRRTIKLSFSPNILDQAFDTVMIGSSCSKFYLPLSGSGPLSAGFASTEANPITVQSSDGKIVYVTIPSAWNSPTQIAFDNDAGATVYTATFSGTTSFNVGSLPRGVYFWRASSKNGTQNGKIPLGN